MLGQTSSFANASDLLTYCALNPDLEAGYAPAGQSNFQTLPCEEWPDVLPPTSVSVTAVAASTPSTCLQLFGASEPCIGPIGEYTLLALIAVGIGVWMLEKNR